MSEDHTSLANADIQASWKGASSKQREKLLELIRRLAEDDKVKNIRGIYNAKYYGVGGGGMAAGEKKVKSKTR